MPLGVLCFGNYLLPVEEGEAEVMLDGYDGFFDQAFHSLKVGDEIPLVVNDLPDDVRLRMMQSGREAPPPLDPWTAARVFEKVTRLRYLLTEITQYHGDSEVAVRTKDACRLGDFADGTRRPPQGLDGLRAETRRRVRLYLAEKEHRDGFWPELGCPLPSVQMLQQARKHGMHGGWQGMSFRWRLLLVKHRQEVEAARVGVEFIALLLGSNDRASSFLLEIPGVDEYAELLTGFVEEAESAEEARIWQSRLGLRPLA